MEFFSKKGVACTFMNSMKVVACAAGMAFFAFSTAVSAQAANTITKAKDTEESHIIKVSGVVVDETGEPIMGATVKIVGTNNGAITDMKGGFTLDNVQSGSVVEVAYIGYADVYTKAAKHLRVVMKEADTDLEEVVVVGYGTMRRKDVTSSITTVRSEDLNKGVYTDPAQLLQGKVAGLMVTQNGDPSGTPSITLRGASTLREGEAMQPYYIIDGVPGMDISLISADDIESIDVLRDATATAIYGSKAANGVIIITTKRGKAGSAHITYNGYVALDNALRNLEMMSASDMRAYAAKNNITLAGDEGADTDWTKEVQRTAFSHNHNIGVTGGNDKSNYNVNVNYMEREGVVRGTDFQRINAKAMAQSKVLNERLTLSLGVNAMQGKHNGAVRAEGRDTGVTEAMYYYSPLQPVRNEDGSWYESKGITNYYNPLSIINEDRQESIWRRNMLTGKADLKVIKGLTWSGQLSYTNNQRTSSSYHSTKSQMVKTNGQANRNTYFGHKTVFETFGNYEHNFGQKHHFGAMVGYSWEENTTNDGFGLTVKDFYNDEVTFHNLTYANKIDGMDAVQSGAESTLRMISFYGRVNYSYNSKYNFQATLRRDGSSAFGVNNRWATFPSFSAAWRLSEEKFIKNLNIFHDLKLRMGYGVSGNSLGFDAYTARRTYGASGWFSYTDSNGNTTDKHTLAATNNANPDLKWEKTGMFNVGVDFSFLDGRINGVIECYDKRTSDLIYYYPVSTNRYPFGTMTANVGDIRNTGIEFTLSAVPVKYAGFEWSTTLNLAHNNNVVKKISNQNYSVNYIDAAMLYIPGGYPYVQRLMEGSPIGQFYTYEWAGYTEDGVSQYYVHDATTGERTGEYTTSPADKDRTALGSAQPKLTYGWNNTFTYKNWSLNMFFQGTIGNKIYNVLRANYNAISLVSQGKNVLKEVMDKPYSDVNAQVASDRYLEDGSYLRLSTLSLSYNFGNLHGIISNLSVYATCNNLFTLTGYKGVDPEVSMGGLTPGVDWNNSFYPHTRSFILGAKVNF